MDSTPGYGPPVPLSRLLPALMVAVVAFGACTTVSPDELEARFTAPTSTVDPVPPTTTEPGPDTTVAPPTTLPTALSAGLTGSLAIGGLPDLVVTEPNGRPIGSFPTAGVSVTQPTWSRDGSALIASAVGEPVSTISVRDGAVTLRPARRPYFFYSWSTDGRYVAALGPGPLGTTLDILAPDGVPVAEESVDGGSFYLAWEPGGDDLVVHRDRTLGLIRDPADLTSIEPLGEPGQSFLAPAWIPGSRDILIVEDSAAGPRLVRLDVDTLASDDLGPVDGAIGITVSPDGTRAVLAHAIGSGGGGDIAVGFVQQQIEAATEVVDLATGERTAVSEKQSLWTEWSPDGTLLALMQPNDAVDGAVWAVWDGEDLVELDPFLPTLSFFRNYVFFSWQFTESPRIWSPAGDAIVYGASRDGIDGVWVREIGGDGPVRVSDGDVGFWSAG